MPEKYIKCLVCGGTGIHGCGSNGHSLACETCHGKGILEEKTMDLENLTEEANEAINVKADPVNPNHYKSSTSLECIEAMEIVFGINAVIDFCVCNAWKYIWRWKNKNGAEDLDKAKWYVCKARELIDVVGAKKRQIDYREDILMRIRDYIDDIERNWKNEE